MDAAQDMPTGSDVSPLPGLHVKTKRTQPGADAPGFTILPLRGKSKRIQRQFYRIDAEPNSPAQSGSRTAERRTPKVSRASHGPGVAAAALRATTKKTHAKGAETHGA